LPSYIKNKEISESEVTEAVSLALSYIVYAFGGIIIMEHVIIVLFSDLPGHQLRQKFHL
jgi:hypothetical protein